MNRNEIDLLLERIAEGNGSKAIKEVKTTKMELLKALEIDKKYIINVFKLYRVVDFFYNDDVLLDAKINERVYNTLKYHTTIDDNLELSKLLKFLTNCIAEVVKYGYCVVAVKMDRSNEINYEKGIYEEKYNFDYKLLRVYDCYVYDNVVYKTDADAVQEVLDKGYDLFVIEGQKKNGSVISVLEVLIAKHYTFSNRYNTINGLAGFNMCVVDTSKAEDDLEFIGGKRLRTDEERKASFMSFVGNQAKNLQNNDIVTGTTAIDFKRVNFVDSAFTTSARVLKMIVTK